MGSVNGKEIGDAVLAVIRMWLGTAGEVIALDGKTIRSKAKVGNPHSALQIFSVYVISSGVILAQEAIREKTGKIPVFQEMLSWRSLNDLLNKEA